MTYWKSESKENKTKEKKRMLCGCFICIIMFSLMLPKTKSRQCDTSTSLRLASFRDPLLRKGNSVDTEETVIYLYKTSTTSVQV